MNHELRRRSGAVRQALHSSRVVGGATSLRSWDRTRPSSIAPWSSRVAVEAPLGDARQVVMLFDDAGAHIVAGAKVRWSDGTEIGLVALQ